MVQCKVKPCTPRRERIRGLHPLVSPVYRCAALAAAEEQRQALQRNQKTVVAGVVRLHMRTASLSRREQATPLLLALVLQGEATMAATPLLTAHRVVLAVVRAVAMVALAVPY